MTATLHDSTKSLQCLKTPVTAPSMYLHSCCHGSSFKGCWIAALRSYVKRGVVEIAVLVKLDVTIHATKHEVEYAMGGS
jgi:hypothetical protein